MVACGAAGGWRRLPGGGGGSSSPAQAELVRAEVVSEFRETLASLDETLASLERRLTVIERQLGIAEATPEERDSAAVPEEPEAAGGRVAGGRGSRG